MECKNGRKVAGELKLNLIRDFFDLVKQPLKESLRSLRVTFSVALVITHLIFA